MKNTKEFISLSKDVLKIIMKGVISELGNILTIILDSDTPYNPKSDMVKDYVHYSDLYEVERILGINYLTVKELMEVDIQNFYGYERNKIIDIQNIVNK